LPKEIKIEMESRTAVVRLISNAVCWASVGVELGGNEAFVEVQESVHVN